MDNQMERTEIINSFIKKYNYKSYLEIGVRNTNLNFDKILIEDKIGIEPVKLNDSRIFNCTSDEFFKNNTKMFDIIFVDGLHIAEQVEKDINNSLKFLNENGTIIVHDCNPTHPKFQTETPTGGTWYGTVWKAFAKFRCTRDDLTMYTVDINYGCGVIRRGSQPLFAESPDIYTYKYLEENRKELLNLITFEEFNKNMGV